MGKTCFSVNLYSTFDKDFSGTVTVTQTVGGAPVNLNGYTVTGQVRTLSGVLVCAIDCSVSTPATGVINISIDNTVTKLLTPSTSINHVWGIQLEIAGVITPEIQGGVLVTPEVVYE